MNYKTYALISILIVSLVLVALGTNVTGVGHAHIAKASKSVQYMSEAGLGRIRGTYKVISSSGALFHFISTATANNSNNSYKVSIGSKTPTKNATSTSGNSTTILKFANKTFPVTYMITGNGNKLNKISVAKDNTTLITDIGSQSNGKLTIQLPRSLIDSKKQGNQDSAYAIFEDSQPWQRVQEIKSNSQARTLAIDFDKGTGVIEIAGSVIMPANTYLNPASINANKSTSTTTPTKNATSTSGNSTTILKFANKTFPVTYMITGNGNKLNKISVAKDNTTLITDIGSQSNGKLTIQLPRSLIDSKKQGNQDSAYAIFEDSQPWQRVQEIKSNSQARTLAIDFDKGTGVIEIAGSKVLPEFGTVSAVVFAIAIVAVIITSTKYTQLKFGSLWQ